MTGKEFSFTPYTFKTWDGRYSRVSGKSSAFKIKYVSGKWWPAIQWEHEEGTALCLAIGGVEVQKLAETVNKAKYQMNQNNGGAFVINEFGQVIVPSSAGDGNRLLVGEVSGSLLFDHPITANNIDLSDDNGLYLGEIWRKPYIGIPYKLSRSSKIYFWTGTKSVYLPNDYKDLIKDLRLLRRIGALSFIVNPYGIILTKIPMGEFDPDTEEYWTPVYVGRLKSSNWFAKEE